MDIRFVAGFAVISSDPAVDRALFVDTLGLALHGPEGVEGSSYLHSETLEGARHFGIWPLAEAAEACFGTTEWPDTHPVPQASVEFEVDDVDAAVQELVDGGPRAPAPGPDRAVGPGGRPGAGPRRCRGRRVLHAPLAPALVGPPFSGSRPRGG